VKRQLRRRSKKMAALYRIRRPLVKKLLEDDGPQRCEFPLGCRAIADTVHEYVTRGQGGSIIDRENCRRSCSFHNDWAEDHPVEANRIGWRYLKKAAS
jgi:hypothetical protein